MVAKARENFKLTTTSLFKQRKFETLLTVTPGSAVTAGHAGEAHNPIPRNVEYLSIGQLRSQIRGQQRLGLACGQNGPLRASPHGGAGPKHFSD